MPTSRRRLVPVLLAAAAAGLACDAREVADPAREACTRCHGGAGSAAPPHSVRGAVAPSERGVGAHAAHLSGGRIARPLGCEACHPLPASASPGAPPHLDGHVDVRFDAATPRPGGTFDPTTASCAAAYCHGATLAGGRDRAELDGRRRRRRGVRRLPRDPAAAAAPAARELPPLPPADRRRERGHRRRGRQARERVVDRSSYHPLEWSDPAQHGYAANRDLSNCRNCHGADLGGGISGVSCDACHRLAGGRAAPSATATPRARSPGRAAGGDAGRVAHDRSRRRRPPAPPRGRRLAPGSRARSATLVPPTRARERRPGADVGHARAARRRGAAWAFAGATCSNYCHGATLAGRRRTPRRPGRRSTGAGGLRHLPRRCRRRPRTRRTRPHDGTSCGDCHGAGYPARRERRHARERHAGLAGVGVQLVPRRSGARRDLARRRRRSARAARPRPRTRAVGAHAAHVRRRR